MTTERSGWSDLSMLRASPMGPVVSLAVLLWLPEAVAGPVLHEPLPAARQGREQSSLLVFDEQATDDLPRGIQVQGQVLPRPAFDDAQDGDGGEPQLTTLQVDNRARPDRRTEREEQLQYLAVFQPSVIPFKRGMALSGVNGDGTLTAPSGALKEVPVVGNVPARDREMFWGDLKVQLRANKPTPIPSVSPDSRILSYETRPPVQLTFLRDGADNLFVRASENATTQLVFLTDAPRTWFGGAIQGEDHARSERFDLPQNLRRDALTAARQLKIAEDATWAEALRALVSHFRSFRSGNLEQTTESTLLDVVLSQTGICRHRSHWFVIMAQALGIRARYVHNEAHAFVEVRRPGPKGAWLRIDLGGDAERLEAYAGEDKIRHRNTVADPFDLPAPYRESVDRDRTAGAMEVSGLPRNPSPTVGDTPNSEGAPRAIPESLPIPTVAHPGPRQSTITTLVVDPGQVYRGDSVLVEGAVQADNGDSVRFGMVQILLRATHREEALLVGGCALNGDGRFQVRVLLPETVREGNYELVAQFMGSRLHEPSVSP